MRNLKLSSHKSIDFSYEALSEQFLNELSNKNQSRLCINPITKNIFIINKYGVFQIYHKDSEIYMKTVMTGWEDSTVAPIASCEFVTYLNKMIIVTEDGAVNSFWYDENDQEPSIECICPHSSSNVGACWSPDQEILVLSSTFPNSHTDVLLLKDFDQYAMVNLDQKDFGENKFINVGWGKKETQFRGKEGKHAAKEETKETPAFDWDDKLVKITWRGDGELFAVSYINSSGVRKIRVINREGIIISTSEEVEGLEDQLCWKPSGSVIAASQRLPNKHNIIFFEKNGLQHGGFTLPYGSREMKIKNILWNSDSTVLLIWLHPFDNEKESIIQLWTVGNYHWYLKEEIKFSDKIQDLKWDPDESLTLYLLFETYFKELSFVNYVNYSRGSTGDDECQVAVIDGKKLLVTPFKRAVIPPPMSAYEIVFPDQIHAVIYAPQSERSCDSVNNSLADDSGYLEAYYPGSDPNNFCVFHGNDSITFFALTPPAEFPISDKCIDIKVTTTIGENNFRSHNAFAQCKLELNLNNEESTKFVSINLYNWCWTSKNTIIACYKNGIQNSMIVFHLEEFGTERSKISVSKIINLKYEVVTVSSDILDTSICLQSATGALVRLNLTEKQSLSPWMIGDTECNFPQYCDHVFLCKIPGEKCIPLGLTSRNRLYVGSNQILSNCSSVYILGDHIIATTTSHQLLVIPIRSVINQTDLNNKPLELGEGGARQIERGSRIVRTIEDSKVLLQMPRGNLEMISPRALLMYKIRQLLNKRNYSEAVNIMRKHRIDMNVIYDHNPLEFLRNIDHFIKDVNNPHWIDLFTASLKNKDIEQYSKDSVHTVQSSASAISDYSENKVDKVCLALRESMLKVDKEKFLLPILTTYVKSSSKDVEKAHFILLEMKNTNKKYKVSVDEGFRHLLYMVDVNDLCEFALGTCDFELIMWVYEKSQKDPKEYLPFLNNFKNMDENYRKFRINVYLKRYKNALYVINTCDEKHHEECLALIKKEVLYSVALQTLDKNSSLYRLTCESYGDYLLDKGYENEAAIMYSRGYKLEKALELYERTLNWRNVIITAFQLKFPNEKLNQLYYSLVEKLKTKCCYSDAAAVYEKYIHSEEDAVDCLCKGHQWEDALLIATKHRRKDLVESIIIPSISEHLIHFSSKINEQKERFKVLLERLMVVRSEKVKEFSDFLEGDNSYLNSDLRSDSSTVSGFSYQRSNISKPFTGISASTGRTYRSSKNKRKLEKKKYSSKEGSTFEDLGLTVELHDLITGVSNLGTILSDLNRVAVLVEKDSEAKLLQEEFSSIIEEFQKNKFKIWLNSAPPLECDTPEFGPQMSTESVVKQMRSETQKERDYIIQRINELEPHYRYPPNFDKVCGWRLFSLK